MEKLTEVQVDVPYKGAGNVIRQREVFFEVFHQGFQYDLVPILNEAERRIANLPESLKFHMVDGKPISSRGQKDGNYHVIQAAVHKLYEQQLL
jgi:hypothetical protein